VTGKIHFCQRGKPGTEACDEHLHEMGFDDVMSHGGKVFTILAEETDSYKAYLQKMGVADAFYEDYKARQFGDRLHWFAAPSALSEEDFHDAYIGQITADWIGDYDGDKPFFCWCNWGGPHSPWDAPGRYAEMYDPAEVDSPLEDPLENAPEDLIERQQKTMGGMPEEAWRDCRSHYYGMINVVDDGIGKMLDALQQTGNLENTIVVYASDHG
jgi:arylsulfatase